MGRQSANLDLLRATAVLLVLANHSLTVFGIARFRFLGISWGANHLGQNGVFLFFIHTSLVLMMSLQRLVPQGRAYIRSFYVRRAFRIYPLSVFTVMAVLLLRIPTYFQPSFEWLGTKAAISNLLLAQNLTRSPSMVGPLWSLPFEVQMYVLLPFIYLAARRIRSQSGAVVLLASGFVLWWAESHLARVIGYPPLFAYAPWFFMGCASFSVSRIVAASKSPALYAVFLLALAVSLNFVLSTMDYRAEWLAMGLGCVFAFGLPHFRDITLSPLRRSANVIATYSYGLYLWHVPILWFAFRRLAGIPLAAQFAICVTLLCVLPVLLHHFLEAPMITMGARIAKNIGHGVQPKLPEKTQSAAR